MRAHILLPACRCHRLFSPRDARICSGDHDAALSQYITAGAAGLEVAQVHWISCFLSSPLPAMMPLCLSYSSSIMTPLQVNVAEILTAKQVCCSPSRVAALCHTRARMSHLYLRQEWSVALEWWHRARCETARACSPPHLLPAVQPSSITSFTAPLKMWRRSSGSPMRTPPARLRPLATHCCCRACLQLMRAWLQLLPRPRLPPRPCRRCRHVQECS